MSGLTASGTSQAERTPGAAVLVAAAAGGKSAFRGRQYSPPRKRPKHSRSRSSSPALLLVRTVWDLMANVRTCDMSKYGWQPCRAQEL